jgi:hypothetical protein
MKRNEAIEPYTEKDFDLLLKTNKSFRDAYNELNTFFSGATVSQDLLNEIEEHLKSKANAR